MTIGAFRPWLAGLRLHECRSRNIADRRNSQINSRGGSGLHGGHCGGGRFVERGIMHSGVVPAALRLGQQEALLSGFPRGKQRLTSVALPISKGLREGLVACLRQQKNADDADKSAAGKYNVVEEIAFLIVELHDWGSQHAETSTGQDQAQTTTSAMRLNILNHAGI